MKGHLLLLLFTLGLLSPTSSFAQEDKTIQPTIMVIPFTNKKTGTRQAFEYNDDLRVAISKVKEGFDRRGVNTIDFRAKLKQMQNMKVLQKDQQSSVMNDVIEISGADIYVEVEVSLQKDSQGNSSTVIMTAYDAFSSEALASKVGHSPMIYTDNFAILTEKAVEAELDNFLNTIQEKFSLLLKNGRSIVVNIGVHEDAEISLQNEFGDEGYLLSELIEDWFYNHSFEGYFHIQGQSATKMYFDIVKVPFKDSKGRNYRISTFARDFRMFMKEYDIRATRTINGATVTITLNETES